MAWKTRTLGIGAAMLLVLSATLLHGQSPSDAVAKHLAAGEFGAAKAAGAGMSQGNRDALFGKVSGLQAATGNLDAALNTTMQISGASSASIANSIATSVKAAQTEDGGAGGGAIADFDSLMELIQTTVVPDTWEALGGPSTMSPYAAGVVVTGDGLIQDVEMAVGDQLNLLRAASMRQTANPTDWRAPAVLRKVSLKRLQKALLRTSFTGGTPTSAMQNLAGLSHIQYIFLSDDRSDMILAGPVTGMRPAEGGHWVDDQTGCAALQLDSLAYALEACKANRPFGCTIEPTAEGVQRVSAVQAKIASRQLAIAAAGPKLKEALGPQEIRVFGTRHDSVTALMMVQADRHMKQLALGTRPMPRSVPNYMDIIKATVADGPLTGNYLRLWFASQPLSVRADSDKRSFELSGCPLQLMSESEAADQLGNRHATARDVRAVRFAEAFNEHFDDIAREYPLYSRLRGLYELTAVAQVMKLYLPEEQRNQVTGLIARPDLWAAAVPNAPTTTESLVVYRRFREGKKIHSYIVASGGVQVNPSLAIDTAKVTTYATLDELGDQEKMVPVRDDRWWWD